MSLERFAAGVFALALLHTFSTSLFQRMAHRSVRHAGLFHLLGEVEVVFGFWAFVLVGGLALMQGSASAVHYLEARSYTEPLFVFVIMVVAASRPLLLAVGEAVTALARLLPGRRVVAEVWLGLAVLPLAGSFITEPAAMTLAALLLAPRLFRAAVPERWKYAALGVLFVNVSIGGTLTSFAAPPVLMVAGTWGWDAAHMLQHFGWKAALAVLVNATVLTVALARHLEAPPAVASGRESVPWLVVAVHGAFLLGVVVFAHHPVVFLGLFMGFLGYTQAYARHQSPLLLREALLVAFFLAGLVVLGGLQQWWLQPLVEALGPTALFFGAVALTAVTDNAALTYLGAQIPHLPEASRYLLVAGAVAGGGLTVIANAPNPAGAALLRDGFEDGSIGAGGLLLGALAPTAVAVAAFWWL